MEVNYIDPEQFTGVNDKLDFKFILMRQIDKVRLSKSTEMRGGHYEDRPVGTGGGMTTIQVYIPDTRETYINSVDNLRSLLIPYWDDKFTSQEKKLNDIREQLMDNSREAYKRKEIDSDSATSDINKIKLKHTDMLFEELLRLCHRAKLIGGSSTMVDEVR